MLYFPEGKYVKTLMPRARLIFPGQLFTFCIERTLKELGFQFEFFLLLHNQKDQVPVDLIDWTSASQFEPVSKYYQLLFSKIASPQGASVQNYPSPRFALTKLYQLCFAQNSLPLTGASIQNYSKSQICFGKDLLAKISTKQSSPHGCLHPKLF